MLQACAQAIDFKVGHHFGEGQLDNYAFVPCLSALQPTAEKHERELKNPSMASQGFHRDLG
jgi:hypothetical protein